MKIPRKLKGAMKRYYDNRKAQNLTGVPWDKAADIKNIVSCIPKNCTRYELCAGTFFFTWRRPRVRTVHSEKNYWACKVLDRKVSGSWVQVSDDWS